MHSLSQADDASVVKFRGATYDAAVEAAQQALGPRVKVIAADRIRRGGIGGFFATELGVEVSVALHDETVDQALERLVAATAEEESSRWFEQLTSMTQAAAAPTGGSTDVSTAASTAATITATIPATTPTTTPAMPTTIRATMPSAIPVAIPVTEPSMTQLLTARAVAGADTIVTHVAVDSPAPAAPSVDPAPGVVDQIETPGAATPQATPARRRILLPTRGHVDLAVSAAAELARLTSEQLSGRRISVHVVVTSDDGRSVEADAIIEDLT